MPRKQSSEKRSSRRAKRQAKKNGDRQYFVAVRKIRRHEIDEWQMKHHPKRFRRRAIQLAEQAAKRQAKQEARDAVVA